MRAIISAIAMTTWNALAIPMSPAASSSSSTA
jgi:hypothetical protein